MYKLACGVCRRVPSELDYVKQHAGERGITPEEYVKKYDPTWNEDFNSFICDYCHQPLFMELYE